MTTDPLARVLAEIAEACPTESYRGPGHGIPATCIDAYCRAIIAGASYAAVGQAAGVSDAAVLGAVRRAAKAGNLSAIDAVEAARARRGVAGRQAAARAVAP